MKALTHATLRQRIVAAVASTTALLLLPQAPLSNAATSGIVGFYNVTLPAGNSAWVSGLITTDIYQGASATVTADVDGKALVTFTSPGWTGGEFTAHYAEPQSGTCAGLAIDILSNTADTLKLDTTPAAAGLSSGMVFIVRKHSTLGGLLPDGGGLEPFGDSISLFTSDGAQHTYLWDDGSLFWTDGTATNKNNTIIRPGQGLIFQVSQPLTLTLGKGEVCHVKTGPTKVKANGGKTNLMGPITPLAGTTTLGSLGIRTAMDEFNDSLIVLTPGSLGQSGVYLNDGSTLINGGTAANANNVSLPAGASIVLSVDASKNVPLTPVTVTP